MEAVEKEPRSPQIDTAPAPGLFGYCGTCGTLLGPERNPQLLPCLHSLCQGCTPPQGPRASRRECPVCERSYSSLEVTANRFLKGSLGASSTREVCKCAGCEDFAVSGWCVECGEALCSVCVSAHQRVRVTRDHTVLQQKLPTDSAPTVFCSTHKDEAVKLFCMTCNQLTCRDCQLTYHRNHSYQFLHEAMTTQREQIESLVMRVKQQRAMVKRSLQDLDGRLQDLKALKSKLKDEMQEVLVRMRYILMKRSVKLFKDVEGLYGSEAERVTERQAALRRLMERQDYVLAFTVNALERGNHIALLSNKRQIQLELEDLLSQNSLPATSMMDVIFQCEQDMYSRITRFGKIITKEVPFARLNLHTVPSKASDESLQTGSFLAPQASASYPSSSLALSTASPPQMAPASLPSALHPSPASSSVSTSYLSSILARPSLVNQSVPPRVPSPSVRYCAPPPPPLPPYQPQSTQKTWSFHIYQPRKPTLASHPSFSTSPDPSQYSSVGLHPSGMCFSVTPMSVSSPSGLHPVTSPPVIIVSDSPNTNSLATSSNVGSACPTQASANPIPPAQWNMGFSIQSVKSLCDNASNKDDKYFKTPVCLLPVKAIADSPCERAPPAGSGRECGKDKQTQAAENEPTSTVTEAESVFQVNAVDSEENDLHEDQSLCPKMTWHNTSCPSNVNGNKAKGVWPATVPLQKPNDTNAWMPTSFRELLERPLNPSSESGILPRQVLKLQPPTSLRDLLATDSCTTSQLDSSDSMSKCGNPVEEPKVGGDDSSTHNEGVPRVPEPAQTISRSCLPRVSLWRLPVSLPPLGNPLPQFRLLPGSTRNKVRLQAIDEDQQIITLNTTFGEGSPTLPQTDCAVCRTTGQLWLCVECGRAFHGNCHIPRISSTACLPSSTWKCLLCRDLSDDEDPYSNERERRPTLSLRDQKKCEFLLLTLMCKKYSDILHRTPQLSSNYIDISLIHDRLQRKLSPSYRTPSEFVSDVWVLLDTLLDVSEESSSVEKLQKCFQKKLNKIFGKTLHPSLLKCPNSRMPKDQVGLEVEESRETLKNTQESGNVPQDMPVKKCHQDDSSEMEHD